ncbi:acetyl/propionyl/methylcrotonyl-CoA carboxylase subunit alpha [Dongia deserti]|uniref:acetyl/propionyl/methylcrotonyl-CoA carboxylase subunit alpha n=1 Tax=Dongia deserti TaxID=2268030 RepID=UPI000E6587FB|nr:acetyl/propionyl/methylcrotonyl-CoA carboxylase subunit alpha [Dongia deserti]
MFRKILIANRGEIACRIMRTTKRLGVSTVAVYSEADAHALHVEMADEAVLLGSAPAAQSYLAMDKVIAAAVATGAEAIHPGYGFLSENARFAEACGKVGVTFIGPPAAAIHAMGSKSESKLLMERARVPLVPGYHGAEQADSHLIHEAMRIGFPVLIKASAGGGGKGMRIVRAEHELQPAIDGARREAKAAFGDERLLIEKYMERPRHVEVQVFADSYGNAVYIHDRDCSIQRRHQKVIEEAPAPGLSEETRKRMGEAAVAAAKAVGYVGAGTVEFLYADGQFYFIEMNTRLQVEHPVTEMIAGLDLVEWQLRVASGEKLPETQGELQRYGHAMEVRLYAEDPTRGFLPATGRLAHLVWPTAANNLRIDSGVRAGDVISTHYDPMIAKVIAWGEDRTSAVQRLRRALTETEIAGLATNAGFLIDVLGHPNFLKEEIDTGFIERHRAELLPEVGAMPDRALALAAAFLVLADGQRAAEAARHSGDPHSPWGLTNGWRLNGEGGSSILLRDNAGQQRDAHLTFSGALWSIAIDAGAPLRLTAPRIDNGALVAGTDHGRLRVTIVQDGSQVTVIERGRATRVTRVDVLAEAEAATLSHDQLASPMPGTVVRVMVEDGASVTRGQPLMVVEAMKMEHTIAAHADGIVRQVKFRAGDPVAEGVELIAFEAES